MLWSGIESDYMGKTALVHMTAGQRETLRRPAFLTQHVFMQEMSIVQQATGEYSMASQHRKEALQSNKRLRRVMTRAAPAGRRNVVTAQHTVSESEILG